MTDALAIIAIILSGGAVYISYRSWVTAENSYKVAKDATHAQTLVMFLEEYSTPEMEGALKRLGEYQFNLPGKSNQELLEKFRTVITQKEARDLWYPFKMDLNHPYNEDLNNARRKVLWYFKKAYFLHANGYLPEKLMAVVTGTNAYRLLFDVVWPITRARHLGELTRLEEDIAKELKRFDWFHEMQTDFPPEVD